MGGEGSEGLGLGGAPLASFTWRREAAGGGARTGSVQSQFQPRKTRKNAIDKSRVIARARGVRRGVCAIGARQEGGGGDRRGGAAAYPVEHAGVDGAEGELRLVLATAGVGGRDSRGRHAAGRSHARRVRA